MSAIVRCTGRENITFPFPGVRKTEYSRSCGWTSPDGTASNFCPRCGGEVELIPEEHAS